MGVALAALSVWYLGAGATVADKISLAKVVGAVGENGLVAMTMYVLLVSVPLYMIAKRKA